MGIKFYCPNGHKVNVKSFLAGKKGLCPKCGVRVDIPLQSVAERTGPSSNGDAAEDSDELVEQVSATMQPAATTGMNLDPLALGAPDQLSGFVNSPGLSVRPASNANAGHAAKNGNGEAGLEMFGEAQADDFLLPPGAPAAPQSRTSAPWHLQFSTGQQLGPLDDSILQQWLGEGRIGPDDLLWREGWSQWQSVSAVFPHRQTHQGTGQTGAIQALSADDPLQEAVQSSQNAPAANWVQYRHQGKKEIRARLSLVLLGLVIVLFALLLYVFCVRDQASTDSKSAGSTPANGAPANTGSGNSGSGPAGAKGAVRDPAASMLAPTQ
jgi:hypothetical protein